MIFNRLKKVKTMISFILKSIVIAVLFCLSMIFVSNLRFQFDIKHDTWCWGMKHVIEDLRNQDNR